MGFVEIYLSDEDKFKVLLLALGLILLALLCSICLACSLCPLNRWLLERSARKRRQQSFYNQQQRQQQQQQQQSTITKSSTPVYLLTGGINGSTSNKLGLARAPSGGLLYGSRSRQQLRQVSNAPYGGPPPAYEAALRATRLQSLTGTLPQLYCSGESQDSFDKHNTNVGPWPPQMVCTGVSAVAATAAGELDLGDYFHQPKEFTSLESAPYTQVPLGGYQMHCDSSSHRPASEVQGQRQCQMPIMLRIWVKMMEPGELVRRARGLERGERSREHAQTTSGRMSLSRQLSIPQLFGSLVSLASGKPLNQDGAGDEGRDSSAGAEQSKEDSGEREMHSIISIDTNTSSSSEGAAEKLAAANEPTVVQDDNVSSSCKRGQDSMGAKKHEPHPHPQPRRRSSSFMAINSVTSRVLHMNVASFSYVRDEHLISTKKHNQLNYHHFFTSTPANKQALDMKSSKLCQLVISICDIENILNSCWLNEKSCALLAYYSAIYVQCEILLPKTKSARLLSYPLRALNQPLSCSSISGQAQAGQSAALTHTVNFSTAISAAALERQPPPPPPDIMSGPGGPPAAGSICGEPDDAHPAGPASGEAESLNGRSTSVQSAGQTDRLSDSSSSSALDSSTNWRHQPQADGRSIVIFNSVPKQIAHEQELAASSLMHQQETDLIQFDSVFVSPILSKSTIEDGFLRFRVYSQCKYVNETCLAELSLPLKQLLRSETRDNLADANLSPRIAPMSSSQASFGHSANAISVDNQQRQADFILNNLLENLVTANTGSPLSTLIEQISSEEKEAEELEQQTRDTLLDNASVFSRLPWSSSSSFNSASSSSAAAAAVSKKLKLSSSLNECLYRLGNQAAASAALYQHQNYTSDRANRTGDRCEPKNYSDTQLYQDKLADLEQPLPAEGEEIRGVQAQREQEAHEKLMEQNYCRSLMVSHWLNYLVAPSYECQLSDDSKGKIILGLTYLPTSNRLIFNAHKANIDNDSYGPANTGKHMMKNLRLQSSTCYLMRFLMIVNGRIVKRKQTTISRRPEWDSQEPITFDLASVSVAQPHFIVALVMRNASLHSSTGSLQNLQHQRQPFMSDPPGVGQCRCSKVSSTVGGCSRRANKLAGAHSEPETSSHRCLHEHTGKTVQQQQQANQRASSCQARRDLVIGHMVIGDEMWRELRLKPRKQIVRQFKIC